MLKGAINHAASVAGCMVTMGLALSQLCRPS